MLSLVAMLHSFAKLEKKVEDIPVKRTFIQYDLREIQDNRKVQSWSPSHSYSGATIKKVEAVQEVEPIGETGTATRDGTPVPNPASVGDAAQMCDCSSLDSVDGMLSPQAQAVEMMPLPHLVAPAESVVEAEWTTVILRNIPCNYSRQDILNFLDEHNVRYDFVYLPMDFQRAANLGYAFVNVVSNEEAERIMQCLNGHSNWSRSVFSQKQLSVVFAKCDEQGLMANIKRYQDSPVMHPEVPEEWKPVIFDNGQRQEFPPPTKRLKWPRGFKKK